ncbi:MAG: hypothetical protein A2428_10190 [Bdellovibrionales bacterium RIFOXYC1_FULL_54_43]|nr:MAG: hypothetical protein A2428_10190 [Bdellovibrionales bacterium RIFOXYC1_FULL_54_43]OFZ80511.1 MAG: hypothetical protein A2603_13065 [Bdellovibrionales bacterium RIFOXYD1_FULL_55_31]
MTTTYSLWFGVLTVFLSTTAGALPVLMISQLSRRIESSLLGASAGVMLGATFFSLLLPSLELYQKSGSSPLFAATWVGMGVLGGAAFLQVFHGLIPHEHLMRSEKVSVRPEKWSRQWLVILAVALHNVPEGLAVGTAVGSGNSALTIALSAAIGIQDFPEGLIVALGLRGLGFSFTRILAITALTGAVEALGVILGFNSVSIAQALLPVAFAACAGAMLFVVSHEIIPESHQNGHEKHATTGVLIGFVLMMVLDLGLG